MYASSKAAVTCLTECLATQLESEGTNAAGRDLLPVGWPAEDGAVDRRPEPARGARARAPRTTEAMTIEKLEAMAKSAGRELTFQDLDELVQVDADGLYPQSPAAYPQLAPPKWFVTLHGGQRDPVRGRSAHRATSSCARSRTAFWDRYLKG